MGQARGARLVSDLTLVGVAAFAMNAGLSAYAAIYNNFLVNNLHITAQALGGLESLREVPGFLTVAMAAVMLGTLWRTIGATSRTTAAIGISTTGGPLRASISESQSICAAPTPRT